MCQAGEPKRRKGFAGGAVRAFQRVGPRAAHLVTSVDLPVRSMQWTCSHCGGHYRICALLVDGNA
eukprot:5051276-Amphidinium_carterae.1